MKAFGNELYTNYTYSTNTPQWMKAERFDYCEQLPMRKASKRHFLARLIFSILG